MKCDAKKNKENCIVLNIERINEPVVFKRGARPVHLKDILMCLLDLINNKN